MSRRRVARRMVLVAMGVASIAAGTALPAEGASRAQRASGAEAVASACPSDRSISNWPLGRLAEATIVDPVDASSVGSLDQAVHAGIGGVLLTGDDATARLRSDLAALLAHAPAGDPPLVMTDEEGGEVQRLSSLVGSMPSARTMAATLSPTAIRALAERVGRSMRALGVTMDLAPVLDLDGGAGPNDQDADGTRSFSVEATVAGADGIAFAEGMLQAGVLPVMKHFPGLGGATGNTDVEAAATRPFTGPNEPALAPFREGIASGLPAVMVANASVPGLTTRPASVSPAVIGGLLRRRLGFSGLVLTDSLSVPSLSGRGFPLPGAALDAVESGADEVLFNAAPEAVATDNAAIVDAIEHAVADGGLSRAALVLADERAVAAKSLVDACSTS